MPERPRRPDILEKMMRRGYEKTTSSPENDEYRRVIYEDQHPRVEGKASQKKTPFGNPVETTAEIRRFALEKGADRVGFCLINQDWVYRESKVPHKYGIVLLKEMDYARISEAPAASAGIESTRSYMVLGEIAVSLGEYIRKRGYEAIIHHPRGDRYCRGELLFTPHAISAGLGEHGRNGLLINPDFGPRVRLGMVSTDLEIMVDGPVEKGISRFCEYCLKCYRACPVRAIPLKLRKTRGQEKFTIHRQLCAPHFEKTDGCSVCIRECTFNQPTPQATGHIVERVAAWHEIVKANPDWPEIS